MESVFLQDANSLVMRPHLLADILTYLKRRFPSIARITSYARAHTVARMALQDLLSIREAGLNRLHIGLESGSDEVLERVRKGVTKQQHIEAGLKAKEAGMELSEYYMPGLGGSDLLEVHALESADALSRINPHFIRLRTLAIPASAPLFDDQAAGRFVKAPEIEVLRELRLFLENLRGVTAYLASDHVLNLFPELEGQLPGDRGRMIAILDAFLEMDREQQALYQLGRRLGIFSALRDLEDPRRNAAAQEAAVRLGLSPDNVDALTGGIVAHFI
jgi:predicted transcriptional regulator